jgi:hypothetical protein
MFLFERGKRREKRREIKNKNKSTAPENITGKYHI